MMLHDFLSECLAPLQDHALPAWMYTGVNDIMRLDHGPGSSLDEDLLAACLKALITDQFSAELVAPPGTCEPICMNQVARIVLLVARVSPMSVGASNRGPLCSRRQWSLRGWRHGHGSTASSCKWRPSTSAMSTPSGHLSMRKSYTFQPRPRPSLSSSRSRTSSHACARSTSGHEMWRSWSGRS
jgi:hypothetical protein